MYIIKKRKTTTNKNDRKGHYMDFKTLKNKIEKDRENGLKDIVLINDEKLILSLIKYFGLFIFEHCNVDIKSNINILKYIAKTNPDFLDLNSYSNEILFEIYKTNIEFYFKKINLEEQGKLIEYVIQEEKIFLLSQKQIEQNYETISQLIIKKPSLVKHSSSHSNDFKLLKELLIISDEKALDFIENSIAEGVIYLKNSIHSKKDLLGFLKGDVEIGAKLILKNFDLFQFINPTQDFIFNIVTALANTKQPDSKILLKIDYLATKTSMDYKTLLCMYINEFISNLSREQKDAMFCSLANCYSVSTLNSIEKNLFLFLFASLEQNTINIDSIDVIDKLIFNKILTLSAFEKTPLTLFVKSLYTKIFKTQQKALKDAIELQSLSKNINLKHVEKALKKEKINLTHFAKIISQTIIDTFSRSKFSTLENDFLTRKERDYDDSSNDDQKRLKAFKEAIIDNADIIIELKKHYNDFISTNDIGAMALIILECFNDLDNFYDISENILYDFGPNYTEEQQRENKIEFAFALIYHLLYSCFNVDNYLVPQNTAYHQALDCVRYKFL